MATSLEDLKVLNVAEGIADSIWAQVAKLDEFARDTVGKQIVRASDSIGANIAESFGRFHYGEKIEFLYYARGSLCETKYWLNRIARRNLMATNEVQSYSTQLTALARQLNAFANSLKSQRQDNPKPRTVREDSAEYYFELPDICLFDETELQYLQSPIPNL